MMKRDKKSLLSELSQLYRIHAANEKTSKQEIIAAILDAKHSRWSAEPSDFKKKVNEEFNNFDEYSPLTAYEVSGYRDWETDRKSTRLNSSHRSLSRMPSSA